MNVDHEIPESLFEKMSNMNKGSWRKLKELKKFMPAHFKRGAEFKLVAVNGIYEWAGRFYVVVTATMR